MEFESHENNQLYGMIEFTHQIFHKFEAALLIIIIISKYGIYLPNRSFLLRRLSDLSLNADTI